MNAEPFLPGYDDTPWGDPPVARRGPPPRRGFRYDGEPEIVTVIENLCAPDGHLYFYWYALSNRPVPLDPEGRRYRSRAIDFHPRNPEGKSTA